MARPTLTDLELSKMSPKSPVVVKSSSGEFAGIVYAQAIDTPDVAESSKLKVATGAGLAALIPVPATALYLRPFPSFTLPSSLLTLVPVIPASAIRRYVYQH